MTLPVDFTAVAKGGGSGGSGYPFQISSRDLMANFAAAALEVSGGEMTSDGGSAGGQSIRKLTLPLVAKSGAYVDLINKPTLADPNGFSAVAFTGLYSDLIDKPYFVPNPPTGGTFVLSSGGWIATQACD